jgi:peroxiredoxin-like protein
MIHGFELTGEWAGGLQGAGRISTTTLQSAISLSPELGGSPVRAPGTNPEELLLAAAGSCYLLTFAAIAERLALPVKRVQIHSHLEVSHEQTLVAKQLRHRVVVTISDAEPRVRERVVVVAQRAERGCMITRALHGNVEVGVDVEVVVEGLGP